MYIHCGCLSIYIILDYSWGFYSGVKVVRWVGMVDCKLDCKFYFIQILYILVIKMYECVGVSGNVL